MSSYILPDHLSRSQNDLVRISVVIHDLQRPVLIHILNNNNIIMLSNTTIDAENVADVTRRRKDGRTPSMRSISIMISR